MPDAFAQLEDQDIDSRVVLDYTSRDFTAIRSQLVGLAKGLMPDWQTAGEASDFGTLLLEIFAYMGDVMHFYIDRTASEAFLGSAIRQQSVLYIANMLGYTPIGQQSASVTLKFSLDMESKEEIVIPVGTRVHNQASNADNVIVFEMDTEVKLPWLDGEGAKRYVATGYATEGIVQHDRLIGQTMGAPNTEIMIPDKGIVFGSISVVTREGGDLVEWTYIDNLALARPTQPVFTTYRDEQEYTSIVFGDNASGRIPPVGAEVFCTYRYGVGAEANTLGQGQINTIINPGGGEDWWGLKVTNPSNPVGGTDPESIDAMRQSIPRAAGRIKNRAITLHDYADLALQVPGVAKSVAYGTVYTAVRVRIAPTAGQGDDAFMTRLCDQVESYMSDKTIVGSTVYAEPDQIDALWHDIHIRLTIHVQAGYNRTSVRHAVEATIRQVLAFDVVDFGTRVSIGQIYRSALAVQGVEWVELTWLNTHAPVDDTDPDQGDTAPVIGAAVWQHDTSNTIGDPGPSVRHYRRDDVDTPTLFAFNVIDDDQRDLADELLSLKVGDHLIYRPVQDVASWMSFVIIAPPTNTGHLSWVQVAVSRLDEADTVDPPGNNDKVMFSVIRYTPTPDSLGGVRDIETPELLIPRITPPLALAPAATVSNRVLTSNVVNLTVSEEHGFEVGELIEVTGVAGVPEVQTITPGGTITSGTFTLTLLNPAVTTAAIQWNAPAGDIKKAIDAAIDSVVPDKAITVAGGPVNTTAFTLTYTGYGPVPLVTVTSSLIGGTLTPAPTTAGVNAAVFNGRQIVSAATGTSVSYAKTHPNILPLASGGSVSQIDPYQPESLDDYPDLIKDEERTHDGLWVIADGGIIGT